MLLLNQLYSSHVKPHKVTILVMLQEKALVMCFVDYIVAAENKVSSAIETLGQGLAALSNGKRDTGVRQDLFHLFNRILEELGNSVGLKAKKGGFA